MSQLHFPPEDAKQSLIPPNRCNEIRASVPTLRWAIATGLIPLSPNDFKCYLTLFSKYFSSFVHTTCSLSVSVQYLAFAEVHLRFCTALSNCTTLGTKEVIAPREVGQERDDSPPWWNFSDRFVQLRGAPFSPCTTIP